MLRVAFTPPAGLALAGPVLACAACSTTSALKFQPVASLETQYPTQGLTARKIEVGGGCYEVSALAQLGLAGFRQLVVPLAMLLRYLVAQAVWLR